MSERSKCNEREIRLNNLMVEILLHWRIMVCISLIGVVVFACSTYAISFASIDETRRQAEQSGVTYSEYVLEKKLTAEQKDNVRGALAYQQLLAQIEEELVAGIDTRVTRENEILVVLLRDNLMELKDEFTSNQWNYYDYLVSMDGASESLQNADNAIPNPSVNLRNTILYTAGLVCLYAFIIFAKYLLRTRIGIDDNLCEIYGIMQMGYINVNRFRKCFSKIDRMILSMREREQRLSREESLALVAAHIKVGMQGVNYHKVHLLSCEGLESMQDVCDTLVKLLDCDGYETLVENNLLYSADAMKELATAECVVILAKAGVTQYEEIRRMIDVCSSYSLSVLGGVIIG